MAGSYQAWRGGDRFAGGAAKGGGGLEIIMLVKWNSPLESTAKVKGRNERSSWVLELKRLWRREVGAVLVLLVRLTSPSSQPSAHQHARANGNLQVLVILTETAVFPHLLPSLLITALAKDSF